MTKGERIKHLRESKGLTQEELAKLLDTKRQTVSKYEQGIVTNIPSDKLEAMSRILDTTPEYILGWEPASNEAKKNSEAIADLASRMLIDNDFYCLVKDLGALSESRFRDARDMFNLLFKQSENQDKD